MTSEAENHAVGQPFLSAPSCELDRRARRLLRDFCIAVGCFALAVATVVLLGGWVAEIDALKSILPGLATMKVNSALGMGALGAALALRARDPLYRPAANTVASVALLIGVVTLAEYALQWNAGIDELLIRDTATAPAASPGRPAAATVLMIALLGLALLRTARPALARLKTPAAAAASLIGWATLTDYVFGPQALSEVPLFSSVAVHTAVVLLLVGVGTLAADPASRLIRAAFASGTGGVICRWLLPPAILAPPILGFLLSREAALEHVPVPFRWALYSAMTTLGSVWLIAALAHRITVIDADRNAAAETSRKLRQALSDLEIFRAVIENSPDFIGIADPQGAPVYLNPTGRRMIGLAADFPIDKVQVADCYPPELRSFATDVIFDAMQKQGRWQGETLFRHFATQQTIPVSDTHFLIRESGTDRVLGSATISRDISEIKRARDERDATNRKLEETNRRLERISRDQRFLAETGTSLAATLDYEETLSTIARSAVREFADHCIVILIDERGEMRSLAVSRDAALGWACEILTRSPFRRDRPHLLWEPLETRRPVLMESLSPEMVGAFAQHDSERARALSALDPRSVIMAPLIAHRRTLGVLAFMSAGGSRRFDAEDLYLAEALAFRAALSIENARLFRAAQRAVQARDEVLGIVAHDLRNPLNSIVVQAGLLRLGRADRGGDPSNPTEVIRRSARRMNRLIQDLLDVARMEAGHLTVERERVATAPLLADAIETHLPSAAAKSIRLQADAASDVPDVWADRNRLLQVLDNLLSNAIRFTGPAGRITLGVLAADGNVVFSVADTGAGIGPEDLPHVFDRFWQARTGERHGTGLGLAIVKGIVEAHDGRVWAISSPGHGTTFSFSIPMAPHGVAARERVAHIP